MQDPVQITGPLTLGEQLDRTFRILRQHIVPIMSSAALILLPAAILSVLFTGGFSSGYFGLIEDLGRGTEPVPPIATLVPWLGFALGGGIVVTLLTQVSVALTLLVAAQHAIAANRAESLTIMQGIRLASRRLTSYVGMLIVQLLAITALALVAMIPFFVLILIFGVGIERIWEFIEPDTESPAAIAAMVGGMVVLLCGAIALLLMVAVPMLYLSARWLAAMPALVNEELGPIKALQRSWVLTKGRVRRAMGLLILLYILEVVVNFPLGLVQQLFLIVQPRPDLFFPFSSLVSFGAVLIWQPFYAVALVVIYLDLRVRSESLDLDARLAQLEAEVRAPLATDAT
jgi:hypothetical protein